MLRKVYIRLKVYYRHLFQSDEIKMTNDSLETPIKCEPKENNTGSSSPIRDISSSTFENKHSVSSDISKLKTPEKQKHPNNYKKTSEKSEKHPEDRQKMTDKGSSRDSDKVSSISGKEKLTFRPDKEHSLSKPKTFDINRKKTVSNDESSVYIDKSGKHKSIDSSKEPKVAADVKIMKIGSSSETKSSGRSDTDGHKNVITSSKGSFEKSPIKSESKKESGSKANKDESPIKKEKHSHVDKSSSSFPKSGDDKKNGHRSSKSNADYRNNKQSSSSSDKHRSDKDKSSHHSKDHTKSKHHRQTMSNKDDVREKLKHGSKESQPSVDKKTECPNLKTNQISSDHVDLSNQVQNYVSKIFSENSAQSNLSDRKTAVASFALTVDSNLTSVSDNGIKSIDKDKLTTAVEHSKKKPIDSNAEITNHSSNNLEQNKTLNNLKRSHSVDNLVQDDVPCKITKSEDSFLPQLTSSDGKNSAITPLHCKTEL
ncbi:hypothetical protein Btru_037119 [Bulinus truncatus]|nr:hypothetical protein Btru_037119 [Bulinus truncatus]